MRTLLETRGLTDWARFSDSWNDLGVDTYMADGGRYRRRRYAAFLGRRHRRTPQARISRTTKAATTTR
ncbi:MAG: 2OG-Fe dioxygenase family protein [Rhodospirillales bacterium]